MLEKVVINSAPTIGKMIIMNIAAVIEHDAVVEDYTHVVVNSTIFGGVS